MRSNLDKRTSRLDFQKMDVINSLDEAAKKEQVQQDKAYIQNIMEAAYSTIGAEIHNKRSKKVAAERACAYNEHFMVVSLTEALTNVICESLLLNTDEYAKLNPEYKNEIKSTVKDLLENGAINEDIKNIDTIYLMNEINKATPSADLYLTEEDERNIFYSNVMTNKNITAKLEDLQRDVKRRVATIVSKDQARLADENDTLAAADEAEINAAPVVPVDTTEAPLPDPDMPEEQSVEAVEAPAPITESAPEFKVYKNTNNKTGIVETLALNEAKQMILEGKEYNRTLALANSLKYITILETFDASGLITIGQQGYNNILAASGSDIIRPVDDIYGTNMVTAPATPVSKVEEVPVEDVKVEKVESVDKKDNAITDKISDIIKSAIPEEFAIGNATDKIFKPFDEWKKEHGYDSIVDTEKVEPIKEDLKGKFTNLKGEVFTEEALREYFENQGFDLNYVDFEDLYLSWHFKKH